MAGSHITIETHKICSLNSLRTTLVQLVLLGIISLFPVQLLAEPVSWQWLTEVSRANQQLSYSGSFVYTKDGSVETMTIDHGIKNGMPVQRLASLGSLAREIVKDENSVACYLPDKEMGIREIRRDTTMAFPTLKGNPEQLKNHYNLTVLDTAKVAGRHCQNLRVTPKDDFRYGYLFCVDNEKFLPLKSVILDAHGKAIETQLFVSITFGQNAPSLKATVAPTSLNWKKEQPMSTMEQSSDEVAGELRYAKAVKGFDLVHSLRRNSPTMDKEIRHLVLSDGLANVSVFIIPVDSEHSADDAGKQMGAINSYSRTRESQKIIALGEVPYKTVQLLTKAFN